ncbi:MAG: response regulator [Lachnospiraceae bacterium]|nr:response regulator [Lachnospiraceae bacterium]
MIDYSGRKILLVEDNELNQEIAVEILREMGFSVDVAMDGVEAVDKMKSAEQGQYDLILMDIQMPHMDGYEAARQIRRIENPAVSGIPIIAMTANAFEDDKRDAFAAGMDGHIAKPIEIPKLRQALSAILVHG